MSNSPAPHDSRCDADIGCDPGRAPAANGVCLFCELGSCSGCPSAMTPEQCAESRRECPLRDRNEVYCPVCLAAIKGDAEEEETVETRTLSDSELLALRTVA